MKNPVWKILSYVLVSFATCLVTLVLCTHNQYRGDWAKLNEISAIIDQYYIGEADQAAMEEAAAAALVKATGDRWSYYIPKEEMQAHKDNLANAYVGIGVTISQREDGQGFDVKTVTQDGPAQEAGIQPGDVIFSIEGQKVSDLGYDAAKEKIRGKEGTAVNITLLRDGQEITVAVVRRSIETVVATGQLLDGGIGLVTIENFNSNCRDKTVAIIEDLRRQGATAIIFDVRFNPGGYRHELVKLLDYLLPEGVLFRSEYYTGQKEIDRSDAACLDMPMAVLINGDSYSAAEFFAAALSEYDAAILVGTQTSGKGYSQQTIPLRDGSALNLSTARYYTPEGVSLAGVGLTPDVVVEVGEDTYAAIYYDQLAPEEDPQIQAAVQALLNKKLGK